MINLIQRLSIAKKISLIIFLLLFSLIIITGTLSYLEIRSKTIFDAKQQLETVRENKISSIEQYFEKILSQIFSISQQEEYLEFSERMHEFKSNKILNLHKLN